MAPVSRALPALCLQLKQIAHYFSAACVSVESYCRWAVFPGRVRRVAGHSWQWRGLSPAGRDWVRSSLRSPACPEMARAIPACTFCTRLLKYRPMNLPQPLARRSRDASHVRLSTRFRSAIKSPYLNDGEPRIGMGKCQSPFKTFRLALQWLCFVTMS